MKRIWFTQQKAFNYIPLRMGLGYLSHIEAAPDYNYGHPQDRQLCPKIFTTRTHRLKGEYYVVEGSRYKARPVKPRIEFRVRSVYELNLRDGTVKDQFGLVFPVSEFRQFVINGRRFDYTFPELDLGIKGATFEELKKELLRLNPRASEDTTFYVHLLEPLRESRN